MLSCVRGSSNSLIYFGMCWYKRWKY